MFICGSRSFSHQEEDENGSNTKPCATSQKTRRSKSFSKITPKNGKKKNPFADRGLDKFSALLADLDKEKQQIFREIGSEDISFIRFVYEEDSQKVKPIIIRVGKQHIEKSNLSFLKHTPKSIEGLYFLPSLPGEGSYSRIMRKRKLSRKNIVYSGQGVSSQTSANMNGGADKFIAQRQHGHK